MDERHESKEESYIAVAARVSAATQSSHGALHVIPITTLKGSYYESHFTDDESELTEVNCLAQALTFSSNKAGIS